MSQSDDWAGLLGNDEEVLWQGAPSGRLRFEWGAFIARRLLGKNSLKRYAITPSTHIELVEGNMADIWFAQKVRNSSDGETTRRIGFEQIPEGRTVFAKFRQIQEAST